MSNHIPKPPLTKRLRLCFDVDVHMLRLHKQSTAETPDGRYLASGGADGSVRLWGLP